MINKIAFLSSLAICASGCCLNNVVPKPGAITLENAMVSVAKGLKEMKTAEGNFKTGLIPSEVTAVFNISATETQADKLYVEIGAPTGAPVSGKLGGEFSSTSGGQRGNQVTVKFVNIYLADEKSLISSLTKGSNSQQEETPAPPAKGAAPAKPKAPSEKLSNKCGPNPSLYAGGFTKWLEDCQDIPTYVYVGPERLVK